ncbi:MAG TPA: aspartate 1-decarboxylase autocleavage activator PanM [Pseudomonadales bacterium]
MPVTLETLTTPSAQDLLDLEKIYADYDFADWPAVKAALTSTPAMTLYGARFNNRLLGAASVTDDNGTAILNHLCVRSVTRRRNVARDLLRLLLQHHRQAQWQMQLCCDSPGAVRLLENAGFVRSGDRFTLGNG